MAAQLVWAESALADLDALAAYIALDSAHYAAATVDRIVACVEHLATFPLSGRVVPEYENPTIREVFWRHYRIVYHVEGEIVTVLAVVRGARQIDLDR
jgi:addiction module RelE/StbE family toxin